MQGTIDRTGKCELKWDLQLEKLYSPDGLKHCLPCESCGEPQWVQLNAVSTLCALCYKAVDTCYYGHQFDESDIETRFE